MSKFISSKCIIGMVAYPTKPSDIHRTWGTLPQYFGLNGIINITLPEKIIFFESLFSSIYTAKIT